MGQATAGRSSVPVCQDNDDNDGSENQNTPHNKRPTIRFFNGLKKVLGFVDVCRPLEGVIILWQ